MTRTEFNVEMKKLVECFPSYHWPNQKVELYYEAVCDLPSKWWAGAVKKMILGNRIDVLEAAAAFRASQRSLRQAEAAKLAVAAFNYEVAARGLADALKKLGAKDLQHAISLSAQKARVKHNGP